MITLYTPNLSVGIFRTIHPLAMPLSASTKTAKKKQKCPSQENTIPNFQKLGKAESYNYFRPAKAT
jgi:hypothetical protein